MKKTVTLVLYAALYSLFCLINVPLAQAQEIVNPVWVGAVSKAEARIPDGHWTNTDFKTQAFKEAWKDVDTLSTKSIEIIKSFHLNQPKENIADATLDICGLGHYVCWINGQRVSDAEFAPLWSDYDKTVYYNSLTPSPSPTGEGSDYFCLQGENVIKVLLGNGMYNVQKDGRYTKFQGSYGAPKLFFRLTVYYKDGAKQVVATDGTEHWRLSNITFNSIYGGESVSLTPNPSPTGEGSDYTLAPWKAVKIVEAPRGELVRQTAPPVKIMERFGVKEWHYTDSTHTTFVCDMGQNLAGFPEITLTPPSLTPPSLTPNPSPTGEGSNYLLKDGEQQDISLPSPDGEGQGVRLVKLTVSERLDKNGLCDQRKTGRPHYYTITIGDYPQNISLPSPIGEGQGVRLDGVRVWHPHFSYYGFRYIQVEGAVMKGEPNPNNLPVVEDLQSCFVYNSAEEYSAFECSNPIFNDAHRLIERAERSNMQAVFTDCPHREKLGWLEQDNLCGPSLLYNYDLTEYGKKLIRDITDAQKPDGNVPTIAPQYVEFGNKWGDFDESPEWGSTLIIFPFQYYEHYGDPSLILDNYEAMGRYIDYLTSRAENGIVSFGLGDWYDYQDNAEAGFSKNTPVPLVATAHYIYDLQLMVKAAEMKKDKAGKNKYKKLLKETIAAFNQEFFHGAGGHEVRPYYGNNSQCSNALPLFLGICPKGTEQAVYQNLVADVMKSGKPRLTTGDVGNRYLIQALSKMGNDQLVYDLFNHEDTPGYAFQVKQGMTTLSEQWNPEFGTSLNHFMMGHIDEWLFRSLAGIRNAEGSVGFRNIVIKPFFPEGLSYIKAKTKNLHGTISVDATPETATVEIPEGCTATVILPNGKTSKVGSGKHIIK